MARQLPQDVDAEMGVLGSMILGGSATSSKIPWLTSGDFYREAHSTIYETIRRLHEKDGASADIITIKDSLVRRRLLDKCGGFYYLSQLSEFVPTPANVEHYAKIVLDKSILRRLIAKSTEIATLAYGEVEDTQALVAQAEASFTSLIGLGGALESADSSSVVSSYLETIATRHEKGGAIVGVKIGLHCLSEYVREGKPGQMIVIAGRPSMGKSALLLQLAASAARVKPILYVSIEMTRDDNIDRLVAQTSRIDPGDLERGRLDTEQKERAFIRAMKQIDTSYLHFLDKPSITASEIALEATRLHNSVGLGGVFIDYLQYIDKDPSMGRVDARETTSFNSRAMKSLARRLNIPVFVASQLNRSVEGREDKMPELSDLAESGSIEKDADVVVFIMRPDYYLKDKPKNRNYMLPEKAKLIVAKNRNGRTGTAEGMYVPALTLFQDNTDGLQLGE